MELVHFVPSQEVVTGFEVEKRSLTWRIEGFSLIRKCESMINSQITGIIAGETLGDPTQWLVYLRESSKDEKRWVEIWLQQLKANAQSQNPTGDSIPTSHCQIRFDIKSKKGEIIKSRGTPPMLIATEFDQGSIGFSNFIGADDPEDCPDDSLVIQISFQVFKIRSLSQNLPKPTSSLEDIMDKFQVTFSDRLRKDFAGLLKNPDLCTGIKIISNDKKEFTMHRGILAVRSEVFAAMLNSDMIEANSGVIDLPDISATALEVLLNFLNTGDLLPTWRGTEVIVELTNAAEKYQLQDLLQFLDAAMGKVCQLENVGALAVLARRLSLKVAEEELLSFVRKEGYGSLDNFILMWNVELPGTDDEAVEPPAKKQKSK